MSRGNTTLKTKRKACQHSTETRTRGVFFIHFDFRLATHTIDLQQHFGHVYIQ